MGYSVDRLKYKEENDLSYTIIGAIYDVYNTWPRIVGKCV